jgi:hypothetical protein
MAKSSDLMRRLDAAIGNPSLHPNYARGLLREARNALQGSKPTCPDCIGRGFYSGHPDCYLLHSSGIDLVTTMNLPGWATHVAVDEDGDVRAYEGRPVFSNIAGEWGHHTQRSVTLEWVPPAVARLLCVEIPRVPVESEGA